MPRIVSRRRVLGLGGVGLLGGALSAAGFGVARKRPAGPDAASGGDVLFIDETDPTATPRILRSSSGVEYQLPTVTPTQTPTPSPTPSPTATPTPRKVVRPAWSSDLLRQTARTGPTDRPLVALTIDDGWSARDSVLKVLQDRRTPLTLFLAGRPILTDLGFVARALNAGCEIANHTWDHYDLVNKSAAYIKKDLQDFEDLVRAQASSGSTLPYMRPSGGTLNQTVIDASAEMGYRPILWSASSGDGSASTTPAQMVANVLAGAKPGAIILMHFSDRAVIALPAILDGLKAKGLEAVTLSRLFAPA
jgi:peptidoglycan/xylan/chitin deacetylase (PgdA/CDA1 family)